MPHEPSTHRRWYAFDPARVLTLAAVLAVVLVVLAVVDLRRQIAALPDIGRATPQYLLAADDESECPQPRPRETPETKK